ncbi:MAG: hypothetical protein ATN31_07700 [Candidatus Epulonipiscioides saccharophilum]|nr:MAG: hypothetical protein ATN31_07700 [Epulopiscium sp. AS2M-Bin001]
MPFEIQILQYLESIRNPFLNMLMETITFSAEIAFLGSIVIILYWCIDKEFAYKLVFIVLVNALFTSYVKNIVRKPRPFELGIVKPLRVETAPGYSFPSGHTSTATSFWGGAYYILKKKNILIVAIIMSIMVGFTRMYLGVHFPTDIIGGILIGITSIICAKMMLDNDKPLLLVTALLTLLVLILPTPDEIVLSVSCLFGLISGVTLEKKYINMKVKTTLKNQIAKLIIGFAGTGILYIILELTMLDMKISNMIKYILLLLYIIVGAPYVFKKLNLA